MTTRAQLLNSAVAFALACLVMITVHELGHTVAGLGQGNAPVMYGFSVEGTGSTDRQQVVSALTGPVLSLVTGLGILALPVSRLAPFWRLAVLWLGLLSVQEFSGYLITGPFVNIGDIGSALELASAPAVLGWLGFLLGWVITYFLGQHAVRRLVAFASPQQPLAPQLRSLGLFAWLLGAALVIVLSLGLLTAGGVGGGVVVFEALGVLSSGIFLVFVRLFMRALTTPDTEPEPFGTTPWAGVVALLVIAIVRQLAFAGGISL